MSKLKAFIVKLLPISSIFDLTYEKGWWGKKGELYSGSGTDDPAVAAYSERLIELIRKENIHSVVEVGCGDFSIMKQVLKAVPVQYTGFDVSKKVVEFNRRLHQNAQTRFEQADAAAVSLPPADLLIIRQVLQHIDNARISAIARQFPKYRFCLITEHQAIGSREKANLDKRPGPDTRLSYGSGVHLDLPPFNQQGFERWYGFRKDEIIEGREVPAEIVSYLKANPA